MMDKLLPCPFCGGEALMRERYIAGVSNTKHYRRECRHCKATFANWYRSMKKADEAWNRRAQPENEALTNAQRIRSMSDEEISKFLITFVNCDKDGVLCNPAEYKCSGKCNGKCFENRLDWLRQPAFETEGTE